MIYRIIIIKEETNPLLTPEYLTYKPGRVFFPLEPNVETKVLEATLVHTQIQQLMKTLKRIL